MAENTLANGDNSDIDLIHSIVSSLENDLFQLTEEKSGHRFRSQLLLSQLELQLKLGEVNSAEKVQHIIAELEAIVRQLNISEEERKMLTSNITFLKDAYKKLPKEQPADIPHVVLIGETGTGKSTLGNVFLGSKKFTTSSSMRSCTSKVRSYTEKWLGRGREVMVVDTPGFNDADLSDKNNLVNLEKQLKTLVYVSAFVLVFNSAQLRITRMHHLMIEILQAIFGLDFFMNTCIVFTNWSANTEVTERKRIQGITVEGKHQEINQILRERFSLQREIPTFFFDSLEYETGFNREAHETFLDDFFQEAVNLPPFRLVNLKNIERNTQEVNRILQRHKLLLQGVPRERLTSDEAENVSAALDMIRGPQGSVGEERQLARYSREYAVQQEYNHRLERFGGVVSLIDSVQQFAASVADTATRAIYLVRNGARVISDLAATAKSVFRGLF